MNTKRVITIFLSFGLFASLFMGNFTGVQAQAESNDTVTFAALGEQEIFLDGPVDAKGVDFNIPADWSLLPGGIIHINMRVFAGENAPVDSGGGAVGFIELFLNDIWLDTIPLTRSGDYSIDVKIPDTAWNPAETNIPQSLRIYLHDAIRCSLAWASAGLGTWRGLNAAISPTSYLYLPHEQVPIPTDLWRLPYPLFQDTFPPDKAFVVVPDQPTEAELQAALIVEAALARLTDGRLATSFMTASALESTSLLGSHAVFVGHPSAFPLLAEAELPLPAEGNTFVGQQVQAGDGILELVPSPIDPTRAWLIVSANDDAGMLKAAQAVGSGEIRSYGPSNLAIVTSVQAQPPSAYTSDISLASLGYAEESYSGYGLFYFTYWFDVPPTEAVTDGAFFEMIYSNSALLNFEESGVSILLNDEYVGSVRFNDRTTDSSSAKFNIPPDMFKPGRNLILLEVNLSGMTPCIPADEIWVAIKPESMIHTPSLPVSDSAAFNYNLADFPQALFPSWGNLAFILARDNPVSWQIAADIAYQVGINTREAVIAPAVVYADNVPAGLLEANNQVIIGRPTVLPVLQSLAPVLPAPFAEGSDIASEKDPDFTFNVPDGIPVGYLQVLPSPWNNKQVILAVLGNGDQGLQSAALALINETVRAQMAGNFAVTYDNQVIVDNIAGESGEGSAAPVVILQTPPAAGNGAQSGPFKFDLVTIGLAILVIIVIIVVIELVVRYRRKIRTR